MARQVKVITAAEAAALIKNGDVGMSAAASLIQSIVGFVTVVTANWLVKKADSDSALF